MPIKPELLNELNKRRKEVKLGGGEEKTAKRHAKGTLTARERVDILFDGNSFQEAGLHVDQAKPTAQRLPGDGVITGVGNVEGRPVAVFSQDFTVSGGSLSQMHAQKICDLQDQACELGFPIVGINDSGGARIQEGIWGLSGYGQVFYRNVYASGLVPQISIIAGPCAGGAAYSPALTDFLIQTRKNAEMYICGPSVIKAATGQEAPVEQYGTADAHASISGNIHFVAEDDKEAIAITKKLLSFLPLNNMLNPPHALPETIADERDESLNDLVPESNKAAFDVLKVIDAITDKGQWLEVQKDFAKNMVIGFARIEGMVAGIIANQPAVKTGCLDIDSSDKGARFIRFCNAFNIPVVNLVDVPGFMPGLAQERGGIIRHGAKMLFAYAAATVPKITLIMRKAYGGAYLAMCSKDMGADFVYAWPCAEIAVMGAEGAIPVVYKREIDAAKAEGGDAAAKAKKMELIEKYRDKFASPWQAAETNMITDVIEPSETRYRIALALRFSLTKRSTRPPKKHGLIPL